MEPFSKRFKVLVFNINGCAGCIMVSNTEKESGELSSNSGRDLGIHFRTNILGKIRENPLNTTRSVILLI